MAATRASFGSLAVATEVRAQARPALTGTWGTDRGYELTIEMTDAYITITRGSDEPRTYLLDSPASSYPVATSTSGTVVEVAEARWVGNALLVTKHRTIYDYTDLEIYHMPAPDILNITCICATLSQFEHAMSARTTEYVRQTPD